eukprot:m51a1_g455 putative m-phase inducer phosphatase 1-b-like (280) ;mRNA; f:148444-149570
MHKHSSSWLAEAFSAPTSEYPTPIRRTHSLSFPSPRSAGLPKPVALEDLSSLGARPAFLVRTSGPRDVLPTIEERCATSVRKLDANTVADLIAGRHSSTVDAYEIVDCRFRYEYEGGHIKGAVNVPGDGDVSEMLRRRYFGAAVPKGKDAARKVLVFHCEFSQERAPNAARILRGLDREANFPDTDTLCYPHVFILSGGYKEFYESHKELCDPQAYVPMECRAYLDEQKMCHKLKRELRSSVNLGHRHTRVRSDSLDVTKARNTVVPPTTLLARQARSP